MKKMIFLMTLFLWLSSLISAQMVEPIHFKAQLKPTQGDEAEIIFSATIDNGWHLYSTELGEDGPISASFHLNKADGVKTVGKLMPRGNEVSQVDNMVGIKLRFFEKTGAFVQTVKFTKKQSSIDRHTSREQGGNRCYRNNPDRQCESRCRQHSATGSRRQPAKILAACGEGDGSL